MYLATWACIVLIEPKLGSDAMPWLFGVAFFGEALVTPFLESQWRRNIRDALKARMLSRWVPFGAGIAGALFWVAATVATWALCAQFSSFAALGVGIVLTFIWIIIGVAGSIGAVAELAKQRLANRST